jgi:C-terminal processing protease CtpA/Prc
MKKILLPLLAILAIFTSCDDDIDDNLRPATALELSDFVYRGLNFWSLYKEDVPDLANDRFANDAEKDSFLSQFDSPEEAFEALTSNQDRFSILRDDYIVLENALNGVRRSSGMRFSILEDPNAPSNLFGVVRYVINNSPAQDAGVQRGMYFTSVDGAQLTTSSNLSSIFGQDTFTIDLADYDGTTFTSNGTSIALTQVELSINPVHTVRTLDIGGEKIGYLHYTGFTRDFDPQLNAAFAQFETEGVTDLVLDLRYNGGGSIETANDLSSMITGQ